MSSLMMGAHARYDGALRSESCCSLQAISWQVNQCLWREPPGTIHSGRSLLENVSIAPDQIPRESHHVLEKHSDEVCGSDNVEPASDCQRLVASMMI